MTPAIPRPARSGHLPALTGLRFFLALWVIVNHLVGKGHVFESIAVILPAPLQAIMRGAYLAVPTFFVLSGFVLARTYASAQWDLRSTWKYLVSRFARVYPVYLLSLLIVLPFIVKAQDQPKGWLVAMHLTLMQGWWVGSYTSCGWNTPAWTLSCEMFFYLLFPLLIVVMEDWGWVRTIGAALLACVLTQVMWALGVSDQLKPIIHLSDVLMGIAVATCVRSAHEEERSAHGKVALRDRLPRLGADDRVCAVSAEIDPSEYAIAAHECGVAARSWTGRRLDRARPLDAPDRVSGKSELRDVHPAHPDSVVGSQLAGSGCKVFLRARRGGGILHRVRSVRGAGESLPKVHGGEAERARRASGRDCTDLQFGIRTVMVVPLT